MVADMQIFVHLLIVTSVLGFHKDFHKFILGGVVLMDCVSCLKHLALDYELILFGRFKEVNRILGLFLLFGLGLTFLFSYHLRSGLLRFLCGLSGKSGNSKIGFCSKNVVDGKFSSSVPFIDKIEMEKIEKLNSSTDLDEDTESESDSDDDEEEKEDEDTESDITKLKELLKIEHQKVNAVRAELAKERAAAATATEEAMAMILRLQSEKSLLEMEWSQYRRLAEEKQIHDQQVIRSLQWLVWQHEFNRSLLDDDDDDNDVRPQPETPCRHKVKEEDCFNGYILDALENVLYSSRDSDCYLSP